VNAYALLAQLTGSAFLVFATFILVRKLLPREATNTQPSYENSSWIKSTFPFVFASGSQILNKETSVFMLGILQFIKLNRTNLFQYVLFGEIRKQ